MSHVDLGEQMYRLLPAVFRERDNASFDAQGKVTEPGDLRQLLAVYGDLLDALHGTLQQRYYDNFPDRDSQLDVDGRERSCQSWLIPYFAQLLDVALVSPDIDGQRAEVSNAVAWRQRKGTRVAVERIAQAVGQMEVEVQEGWQRVAVTPRLGDPLLPATHYGEDGEIDEDAPPPERARHPGLPAAIVDLRYASRAVRADANNPGAHHSSFAGETVSWRQANLHGAPCFNESYQDRSPRTVDVRTPRYDRGHYHPRRVILHAPPPEGHCSAQAQTVQWSAIKGETDYRDALIEITSTTTEWNDTELPLITYRGLTDVPVKLSGVIDLDTEAVYHFENLWLDNRLDINAGKVELIGCASRHTRVQTAERDTPVIEARGCLFNKVEAARGLVQLEYCTVLNRVLAVHLNASDSIFLTKPRKDRVDQDVPAAGCIRYSRLPETPDSEWVSDGATSPLQRVKTTVEKPLFISDRFGDPGCGVLHIACDEAVALGAEDGGEMGAYHDARHVLRWRAVLDKLADYLPVGLEAALVPDATLTYALPEE